MKKLFLLLLVVFQTVNSFSQTVKTIVGVDYPGYIDSTSVKSRFNSPNGLFLDGTENIYVTDRKNHKIRKVDNTGRVTTFAGSSQGNSVGKKNFTKFNSPSDIVIDSKGNIYVSDTNNNAIKVIRKNGEVEFFAGSTSGEVGNTNAKGTSARFSAPEGLAIDEFDNIFVADKKNNSIRKIDVKANVTTVAGGGLGNVDGKLNQAKFYSPVAIAISTNGDLYVADSGNNKIRKVTQNGMVTTFAGSSSGYVNGSGLTSKFYSPSGVAFNKNGDLFVSDSGNNIIRKITSLGFVTTVAGSKESGSDDGSALTAKFTNPTGLVVNSKGELIIADLQNNKIRKFSIFNNVENKDNFSAN